MGVDMGAGTVRMRQIQEIFATWQDLKQNPPILYPILLENYSFPGAGMGPDGPISIFDSSLTYCQSFLCHELGPNHSAMMCFVWPAWMVP